MGKVKNYDQNGKLKNKVLKPKYSGEMELDHILKDNNWQKLGACSIECLEVIDTKAGKADPSRVKEVNELIQTQITAAKKPKTPAQLLKEQSEQMEIMAKQIEELKKGNTGEFDKSDNRIALEAKATELKISFRNNIGDDNLLAKIVAIEPEFKL